MLIPGVGAYSAYVANATNHGSTIKTSTKTRSYSFDLIKAGFYRIEWNVRWAATVAGKFYTLYVGAETTTPTYDLSAYQQSSTSAGCGQAFVQHIVFYVNANCGSANPYKVNLWVQHNQGVDQNIVNNWYSVTYMGPFVF